MVMDISISKMTVDSDQAIMSSSEKEKNQVSNAMQTLKKCRYMYTSSNPDIGKVTNFH